MWPSVQICRSYNTEAPSPSVDSWCLWWRGNQGTWIWAWRGMGKWHSYECGFFRSHCLGLKYRPTSFIDFWAHFPHLGKENDTCKSFASWRIEKAPKPLALCLAHSKCWMNVWWWWWWWWGWWECSHITLGEAFHFYLFQPCFLVVKGLTITFKGPYS